MIKRGRTPWGVDSQIRIKLGLLPQNLNFVYFGTYSAHILDIWLL